MSIVSDKQDHRWIQLAPSRLQIALTLLGALMAIALLVLVAWPAAFAASWRWLLVGLVSAGTLWELRQIFLQSAASIHAFYLLEIESETDIGEDYGNQAHDHGPKLGIRLQCGRKHNMQFQQADVLKGAFVMPWFTAVPYRLPGDGFIRQIWPRILPLWRDSLDADAFRAVRMRLRWT